MNIGMWLLIINLPTALETTSTTKTGLDSDRHNREHLILKEREKEA